MKTAFTKMYALPVLFAVASIASAQQNTATLTGLVTDASGAPVANVRIKTIGSLTNSVRETTTNDAGTYTIPFLTAGEYSIETNKAGFQSGRVASLALQVGVTARVDIQIKVGAVTESIEVSASAAVLQTENATVGSVIDAQKIVAIPLNGRNFIQLAQLNPGAQAGTSGSITVRRGRRSTGGCERRRQSHRHQRRRRRRRYEGALRGYRRRPARDRRPTCRRLLRRG
jgi:hypothetical protein